MPSRFRMAFGAAARFARSATTLMLRPPERALGMRAAAVLWLVGGITFAVYPALPGTGHAHHLVAVEVIAAVFYVWGLLTLFAFQTERLNGQLSAGSALCAVVLIAVATALTGGSDSPVWMYVIWIGLFGCYVHERRIAAIFMGLCALAACAPLVYDHSAVSDGFLAELISVLGGAFVTGGAMVAGKERLDRLRARSEAFGAEQAALARASGAVIRGAEPQRVFMEVITALSTVMKGEVATILERVDATRMKVVSASINGQTVLPPAGSEAEVLIGAGIERAIRRGAAVANADLLGDPGTIGHLLGCQSSVVAPVLVDGEVWGVIGMAARHNHAYSHIDEQRLDGFATLLGNVVEHLGEREQLAQQALTDQLTGLPNSRALDQRITAELAACGRRGTVLSVAMLDVDNFKEINDLHGHEHGDRALQFVADCMRRVARGSDTVGRLGGDEFMWILPDTEADAAELAVQRARELVAGGRAELELVTTSVGVCDTRSTSDRTELVRRADMALYASKAAGRNHVTRYDRELGTALDEETRSAWLDRSQALTGLRALARAIDAKDPATGQHSERVADFAALLARADGWPEERIERLREAGFVHDVGKLAVPDVLLTTPGRLDDRQRIQMNEHAVLSVRIVGSVLTPEQVNWIRGHHERPDGGGYPDGLHEAEISDGAGLLALADAWDVMVIGRTYSRRKSTQEAYEECVSLVGRQFTFRAVRALQQAREQDLIELDGSEGSRLSF